MKTLLTGALVALAFTAPATPQSPPYQYPMIYQALCSDGSKGTAFRTTDDRILSVAHVTDVPCTINGSTAEMVLQDGELDFSIIRSAGADGIPIDCGGFIPGQWYYAVGYAYGDPWQTTVPVYATYMKGGNRRVLMRTGINGMSGGPILNQKGEAVGMVNARHLVLPLTYSLELKDTPVCGSAA